jgi:DNA helicase-2/ATP-dependent DNA helicase PcrA
VMNVDGAGDDKKATIFFQEIGEKQILVKYAKMKILN